MAIKDWKKIKNMLWERQSGIRYLEIIKRPILKQKSGKWLYHYNIIIWEPYRDIQDKTFKTKTEALKFAKAYMRTH